MILCDHASKAGRDMKWFFTAVDPEKKGILTYAEFAMGIRDILGIWITEEDCFAIWEFIDKDKLEQINFKNFSSIPYKDIIAKVYDKRWFVHKSDFLYCLLAECESRKLEDYHKCEEIF